MAKSDSVKKRQKKQLVLEQKRRRKRIVLCILLSICVIILPIAFFTGEYIKAASNDDLYNTGRIRFGAYPQKMVTDQALLSELEGLDLSWRYYDDCYAGTDFYSTMQQTQCMKYADVEYGGEKYRAVMIERYRPQTVISPAVAEESLQDDNGFLLNKTYWFLFEPIVWVVYDGESGFVLTESVLDAMPFNDSVYWIDRNLDGHPHFEKELSGSETFFIPSNLYKTSTLRAWLNGRFFSEAFSTDEQKQVKLSAHRTDEKKGVNKYGLLSLNCDRIFLPSLRYIARDENMWEGYYTAVDTDVQFAPVTDYARCRGAYAEKKEDRFYSWAWLSTPGDACANVISINTDVRLINVDRQFYCSYTVGGIRCAAFLKQISSIPAYPEGSAQ